MELLHSWLQFIDLDVMRYWSINLMEKGQYDGLYPPVLLALYYFLFGSKYYLWVYCALFIFVMVYFLRQRSNIWPLYLPLLQCFCLGQLDIFIWAFYQMKKPLFYALMTLKPHVALIAIPEIVKDRRVFSQTVIYTIALHSINFILYPGWLSIWLHNVLQGSGANRIGTFMPMGVFGSTWLVVVSGAILLALCNRETLKYWIGFFNPGFVYYNYVIFMDNKFKFIIIISWFSTHFGWDYYGISLIPIYLILRPHINWLFERGREWLNLKLLKRDWKQYRPNNYRRIPMLKGWKKIGGSGI